MEQFINRSTLIMALQDLRITADCAEKIEKLIYNLPTVERSKIANKCGMCKRFERYSATRGFCNKHRDYRDSGDYCNDWEVSIE